MSYSDFVILLARQRSGTNPLRQVLESHPDIFCFTEVFNLRDRDSEDDLMRDSNFFNFLAAYAKDDIDALSPDRHEVLFLDFLEYLRCFSDKPYIVIDVKYNTTHFFTRAFSFDMTKPFLLDLIVQHQLRVLNMKRKNYLRYFLSNARAQRSDTYTYLDDALPPPEEPIRIDVDQLMWNLQTCYEEDRMLDRHFSNYGHRLSVDYAEVFDGSDDGPRKWFLRKLSRWLAIEDSFSIAPAFKKQSFLGLDETIANFEDVVNALRGTRFAYCLRDEPIYGRTGATSVSGRA